MQKTILKSITALLLLTGGSQALDITYSSDGGFVDGTEVGTNNEFPNHFEATNPSTLSDGSLIHRDIKWGIPSKKKGEQSGLSSGNSSGPISLNEWKEFGTLIHINNPITNDGGSLEYAWTKRELHLSDGHPEHDFDQVFTFDLYNWETPNDDNPCPSNTDNPIYQFPNDVYTGDGSGPIHSHVFTKSLTTLQGECWDAHDFAATPDQNFTWVTPENVYQIEIKGFFNSNDDLVHTFWSAENNTSVGYAKFRLTIIDSTHTTVSGRLWVDINHDGIQNDDTHNTAPITVKLYNEDGDQIDETTTDNNGYYIFTDIETTAASGKEYYVKFALPVTGFEFTTKDVGGDDSKDSDVDATGKTDNFALTGNAAQMDAGIIFAALGDYVWNDTDGDGIQDPDENGIGGITVNLYKDGGTSPYLTTQTDPSGKYGFEPLGHGTYTIEVVLPADYIFSPEHNVSGTEDTDSDVNASGKTDPITLNFPDDANHYENYDAGMHIDWPNAAPISITKLTNGVNTDTEDEPVINIVNGQPETVTWSYIILNGSKDANLSDIIVTDDQGVTVNCPKTTLSSGEQMTCTATGIAIPGHYVNTATVTATATLPDGSFHEVEADPATSSYTGKEITASLSIEKSTNGNDADTIDDQDHIDVGTAITWEYIITNTGDSNLSNVKVQDNMEGLICQFETLIPGESKTCTKTGEAEEGQYENSATVTGMIYGYTITDSDLSHYHGHALPVLHPHLTIDKSTNGNSGETLDTQAHIPIGDPVVWTYHIYNDGDTNLSNISVIDDQLGTVNCPDSKLASHTEMTCEMHGTAEAGQYTNTATVTASFGEGSETGTVTASDVSRYFGEEPIPAPNAEIEFDKSTNGMDSAKIAVGEEVIWTYYVKNIGNILLYNIEVKDDKEGDIVCPSSVLEVGKGMRCTKKSVAQKGEYKNIGTVTAMYGDNQAIEPVSDPSSYTGTIADLAVEKSNATDDNGGSIEVGDTLSYTITATNTGNVTLNNVVVSDTLITPSSKTCATLLPGNTCVLTGTYTVEQSDMDAGNIHNTGTADSDQTPPVQDEVDTPLESVSSIDIQKSTNGEDADTPKGPVIPVGDLVTWNYHISNNGNITMYNIHVTDDKEEGAIICPNDTLLPGEEMDCTLNGTATAGQYHNVGTVTAKDLQGNTFTDTDVSHYYGKDEATAPEEGENCPCNDVKSDSSDAMSITTAMGMMLMTLFSALFFMRREEEFNTTAK